MDLRIAALSSADGRLRPSGATRRLQELATRRSRRLSNDGAATFGRMRTIAPAR
jgi:hypothetical protein